MRITSLLLISAVFLLALIPLSQARHMTPVPSPEAEEYGACVQFQSCTVDSDCGYGRCVSFITNEGARNGCECKWELTYRRSGYRSKAEWPSRRIKWPPRLGIEQPLGRELQWRIYSPYGRADERPQRSRGGYSYRSGYYGGYVGKYGILTTTRGDGLAVVSPGRLGNIIIGPGGGKRGACPGGTVCDVDEDCKFGGFCALAPGKRRKLCVCGCNYNGICDPIEHAIGCSDCDKSRPAPPCIDWNNPCSYGSDCQSRVCLFLPGMLWRYCAC